jgi:hypothetical protein
MIDKATLLALADRVEALDGPCFGTEDAIEKATGQPWRFPPPNYTASIDAAMTLCRDDAFGSLIAGKFCRVGKVPAKFSAVVLKPSRAEGVGSSAARAITAAALRAMAGGVE